MDAATRAELAELRRRAYGPGADIDGDPAALARLAELEERSRAEREPSARVLVGAGASGAGAIGVGAGEASSVPAPTPSAPEREPASAVADAAADPAQDRAAAATRPRRRGWVAATALAGLALVAAVALPPLFTPPEAPDIDLPIPPREAYSLTRDPTAVPLLRIPLDGSFGDSIDLPTGGEVPDFPTSGEVEWAEPLGDYYGWNLWVAGAEGMLQREHCLLAQRASLVRARCVPAVLRPQSALVVALPVDLIPRERRPEGMRSDQRIGFWWNDDREVTVLLAEDPMR